MQTLGQAGAIQTDRLTARCVHLFTCTSGVSLSISVSPLAPPPSERRMKPAKNIKKLQMKTIFVTEFSF